MRYETIIDYITQALRDLSKNPPDTVESRKHFSLADFKFNEAVNSMSWWWRFKYMYGVPVLFYLLILFVSASLAWVFRSSVISYFHISSSKIFWVPGWAYLWGAIGGILQGLWLLWQHVSDRDLRKCWFVWYIILPLAGAIFGALTYLIFLAGFVVATGGTNITSNSFVMLLCALAGFNSKWIIGILNNLADSIKVSSSSKSESKS